MSQLHTSNTGSSGQVSKEESDVTICSYLNLITTTESRKKHCSTSKQSSEPIKLFNRKKRRKRRSNIVYISFDQKNGNGLHIADQQNQDKCAQAPISSNQLFSEGVIADKHISDTESETINKRIRLSSYRKNSVFLNSLHGKNQSDCSIKADKQSLGYLHNSVASEEALNLRNSVSQEYMYDSMCDYSPGKKAITVKKIEKVQQTQNQILESKILRKNGQILEQKQQFQASMLSSQNDPSILDDSPTILKKTSKNQIKIKVKKIIASRYKLKGDNEFNDDIICQSIKKQITKEELTWKQIESAYRNKIQTWSSSQKNEMKRIKITFQNMNNISLNSQQQCRQKSTRQIRPSKLNIKTFKRY